jgi:hypothetical protein
MKKLNLVWYMMSIVAGAAGCGAQTQASPAKWTVMVYMNGRNTLADQLEPNVAQMANLQNSSAVNVVVEIGSSNWPDHVYRLKISHGAQMPDGTAVPPGGVDLGNTDMGSPGTLKSFLTWGKQNYPAGKYALIIWDHGAGWRMEFFLARSDVRIPGLTFSLRGRTAVSLPMAAVSDATVAAVPATSSPAPFVSNFRAISNDDISGNHLYNSAVQAIVEASPVDLIGFDACLMSMVETAYAMRNGAKIMVGSEDLEPGPGWNYETAFGPLIDHPDQDASALGSAVVSSYQTNYGATVPASTLSSNDLSRVNQLAQAITKLADTLSGKLGNPSVRAQIAAARSSCTEYATSMPGVFHNIDLIGWCIKVQQKCGDPDVKSATASVISAAKNTVLSTWAGTADASANVSSKGLAIYFPPSAKAYAADRANPAFGDGYEIQNTFNPVAFVKETSWASFIHAYISYYP